MLEKILENIRKTNKWIVEQISPKFYLENVVLEMFSKCDRLKLSYLGNITQRISFLKNARMLIMLIILGKEKEVDQQRGGWTELHQQYECNIERYKRLG